MSFVKLRQFPVVSIILVVLQLTRAQTPKKVEIQFVLSARDLPNTDEPYFGSPDPYVEVSYFDALGSRHPSFSNKTKTLDNNHNPDWNEVFHVKYNEGRGQRLVFKVMDADTLMKDDEIGIVEIKVKELVEAKGPGITKPIIGSRKQSGNLIINTKTGDKVTEDTDTRLFKKSHDQVHLEKQLHYTIIVSEH